jgi:ribonuclease R
MGIETALTRDLLLKFISSPRYRPMRRAELYRHFGITGSQSQAMRHLLNAMERDGELVRVKENRYALPQELGLITGRLEVTPKGFGFVTPSGRRGEDVYVHSENMSHAMHGDTVVVRLIGTARGRGRGKGPRREGKVIKILERANETLVGTLNKSSRFLYVVPDNPRIQHDIYIAPCDTGGARVGQKVVVRITEWASKHVSPEGVITSVLGDAGDPTTDLLSIIHQRGLRTDFSHALLREALRASQESGAHPLRGREDLRGATTFTIDPVDARDFDDAVSLTRSGSNWILGVHIADVAHYVAPGSLLDEEARARSTSVYFPSRVLPMLPETLSNGVCSLKENEDRLTQSVFITFSQQGRVLDCRFPETVIRSRKRFTYSRVGSLLRGEAPPEGETERALLPVLKEMEGLALTLRKNRFKRGALDLDMPEELIEYDGEGHVTGVRCEEFDNSHIMIEEFMLAANEAVGGYLASRGVPTLWRVHDPPDDEDLCEYLELIKPFGYSVRNIHDKRALQAFLDQLKGTPESYALHLAFLRSLKLAVYSTRNTGHYSLGCRTPLQFTSPIRRYPDLITHRFLRQARAGKKVAAPPGLEELAAHCSEAEETAEGAERECLKLRKLQYIKSHLDAGTIDLLTGVITEIRDFGLSVYLNDYLLQGLVHVSSLTDDFYRVARNRASMIGQRTKRRFRVGDIVTVQVARVDMLKREVDFILHEGAVRRK